MRYHRFLRQSTYRRYGLFFITIFFSYYSIQAYLNNISISNSVQQVTTDIHDTTQETAFLEKYYKNYLLSDYSSYFLGHENGMIYDREQIVRFISKADAVIEAQALPDIETKSTIILSSPSEAWHHFIKDKLEELIELGLIE